MGSKAFSTIDDFYSKALKYESSRKMAKAIGLGQATIENYMRRLKKENPEAHAEIIKNRKILARKFTLDENVFDSLDNESAYWLGMLASDGNVHKKRNSITMYAKLEDKDHIEAFKNFLKYTGIVHTSIATINGRKAYPFAYIDVASEKLKTKLMSYGIVPAKSNLDIDYLEHIPNEYKFAFICGYLDGDGSVAFNITKPRLEILGNNLLLKHMQKSLLDMDIESSLYAIKREGCYEKTVLLIGKLASIKNFCQAYLCLDKQYLLERKMEKMAKMLSEFYGGVFCCSCGNIKTGSAHKCNKCVKENKTIKTNIVSTNNHPKPTYKSCPICGNKIRYRANLCEKCYKEYKHKNSKCPSKEKLESLIYAESFCAIARKYGVTDNAVRKWCKYYNLPYKVSEIK